jgi:hypothetical protein
MMLLEELDRQLVPPLLHSVFIQQSELFFPGLAGRGLDLRISDHLVLFRTAPAHVIIILLAE